MKRTKKPRCIALMIILILSLILVVNPAITESQTWDCPECGRTGNTRNYCGGCAHPAPWIENPEPDIKVSVGDIVKFGHYEQDNNTGNGPEEIEWIVLDVQDGKALLISQYGLDAQPYSMGYPKSIIWENCPLRTWLNRDFLNTAFSSEEQCAILITSVSNRSDQGHNGWYIGDVNDTQDQVFLLSCKEANQYFGVASNDSNNIKARVQPTAYAISKGAYILRGGYKTESGAEAGWWWLRSPGYLSTEAACVSNDGSLCNYAEICKDGCIRPALWIDLESDILTRSSITTPTPIPKPTDTPTPGPTDTPTPKPTDTPVPPLKNPTASTETTKDLIRIRVNWEGGISPYHVYLYPYADEYHQYSSADVEYLDQKTIRNGSDKTEVYFDKYLSPDQTYWIKVVDSSEQETWLKYTFPQIPYDGFKVKIAYVFFETRTYGENGYTGKTISKNKLAMTKKNEERALSTLIRLNGNYSDLFPDGDFKYGVWGCTILQPNGTVTAGTVDNSRYTKKNQKYAEWDLNAVPNHVLLDKLSNDYNGWSNIPLGKYTVILTYGNYYVDSAEFTLTN